MPPWLSPVESFHRSYIPEPNSGCWLWEKSLNNRGYGAVQSGCQRMYAHRFSFTLFKGEIPAGLHVCHSCDMPSCVNPDHLWLGTYEDNWRDCCLKGRAARKLTWEKVFEIRRIGSSRNIKDIAADYGVSDTMIRYILLGKSWKAK